MRFARFALLALTTAAANGPPTPLTPSEKLAVVVAQAKVEQARAMRASLSEQRDRFIEVKLRQAIEEWYQSPDGRKYGVAIENVQVLERAAVAQIEGLRKTHDAVGHDLIGENLEWKLVEKR